MGLQIPEIGVETGPAWAQDVNNSLSLIDQHNHTPGSGVQVPSAGLNINTNLSFQGNQLTSLGAGVFSIQSASPSADACIYAKGVDLYYNDGNGNVIQITSNGGVAGTPGAIANLASPASAAYVSASGTFVWQQNSNVAANMDAGTYLIRYPGSYPSPSGNYIAIQAPSSLATGFALTLMPSLPAATSYLTVNSSGNISATSSLNAVSSSSSGTFSTSSTSYVAITNQSASITTVGRPVMVSLQADGTNSGNSAITEQNQDAQIQLTRDSTVLATWFITTASASTNFGIQYIDSAPSAGSHTYSFTAKVLSGGGLIVTYMKTYLLQL